MEYTNFFVVPKYDVDPSCDFSSQTMLSSCDHWNKWWLHIPWAHDKVTCSNILIVDTTTWGIFHIFRCPKRGNRQEGFRDSLTHNVRLFSQLVQEFFFREMGKLRNCSSDQTPHTVKICGKAFFASLPSRTHRKIMLQLSKTFWTTRTFNLNLHILLIQRVTEPFDRRSPTWRRSKPCLPRSAQMIPESSLSKCSKNSSARQLSRSILKVWVWMSPTRGHFSNS